MSHDNPFITPNGDTVAPWAVRNPRGLANTNAIPTQIPAYSPHFTQPEQRAEGILAYMGYGRPPQYVGLPQATLGAPGSAVSHQVATAEVPYETRRLPPPRFDGVPQAHVATRREPSGGLATIPPGFRYAGGRQTAPTSRGGLITDPGSGLVHAGIHPGSGLVHSGNNTSNNVPSYPRLGVSHGLPSTGVEAGRSNGSQATLLSSGRHTSPASSAAPMHSAQTNLIVDDIARISRAEQVNRYVDTMDFHLSSCIR